jgi:site-specific DNA recombinase
MPKPREIMAGYVRESNPGLAGSNTEESQAHAIREYAKKEGYDYPPEYDYKEAISAYATDYTDRKRLMDLLTDAKHGKFSVVVVSEIRALGRKQAEVFVVYNTLQKYGVRVETINEKFEDSAMGRLILSHRAAFSEIEVEQIHIRTRRGRIDRLAGGAVNGHPTPAYGFVLLDTPKEQKAYYSFNHTVVYVDAEGNEWTPYKGARFIFELLSLGETLKGVAAILTDIGVPPPGKPVKAPAARWHHTTIHQIACNPLYAGEVYANRYRKVGNNMVLRPREEWVRLADTTPLVDKETFDAIQKQLAYNKQNATRNSKNREQLGILRVGYCRCGICGRTMHVELLKNRQRKNTIQYMYRCHQYAGKNHKSNHSTQISLSVIDQAAWEKVVDVLHTPGMVRQYINDLREQNRSQVDSEAIERSIAELDEQITNLFDLAKFAKTEDTIKRLSHTMNDLEKQKQAAARLLASVEEDKEERDALEAEIAKFERWAQNVRPFLTDPTYEPTYEEKRLAVRIMGVKATVFPTQGDYPYRFDISVTVPDIVEKLESCVQIDHR